MKAAAKEPTTKEIQTTLRAAGLRSTGARIAVMQRLHRATSPLSHPELALELADQGFDKATIYRNLIDLFEAGLVTRTELGDHVWRFELRSQDEHKNDHPHFVCVDCGEVSCLPDVDVRVKEARGKPRRVSELTEILLKGHCTACA